MAGRTWWCGDPPPSPTAMAGASSERQRERVASSWRQSCCLRLSKGAKVTEAAGPSCVVEVALSSDAARRASFR